MVEKMRAEIEALGGEIRFGQQRGRRADRGRRSVRGLTLASGRAAARRPRGAGAGPQRARHLRDAAAARRVHGGQAVLGGLSHRAPAEPDRPRALRPQRRPPDPRRGRLQAGAPRQERPLGLQLLHVPGRHRGGGHLRSRARRHQRHEPVLAQRAQRQRRHRRRHRRRRTTGRTAGATAPGEPAGRHGLPAPLGVARLRARRRRLRGAGPAGGRLHQAPALQRASAACCRPTSPACSSPTWPSPARAACPPTRSTPSARRCPPSSARSRASRCPTRCSPAWRRAPRRRCASRAGRTTRA